MQTLMHNWYWARASVGPYTVIASYITATEAYGYETQIVYMLAKDGQIVADDEAKVAFEAERVETDSRTGKPVADITRSRCRYPLCRIIRAPEDHPASHFHRPCAAAQADHRPVDRL
jgi:hypothetical protein